jgi:hypothetical protein
MQATLFFRKFHFVGCVHQSEGDVVEFFLQHISFEGVNAIGKQNAFDVVVFVLNDARGHALVGFGFLHEVFIEVLDGYFGIALDIGANEGD